MIPFFGSLIVRFAYYSSRFFSAVLVRPFVRLEQWAYDLVASDGDIDRLVNLFNSLYVKEGYRIVTADQLATPSAPEPTPAKEPLFALPFDKEKN